MKLKLAGLLWLLLGSWQGLGCSPEASYALAVHLAFPADQQPLEDVDVLELTIEYADGRAYEFFWEPGDPSTWVLEQIPDVTDGESAVLLFRGLVSDPADPGNVLEVASGRSAPVALGTAGEVHVYFSRRGRFGLVQGDLAACRAEPQVASVPGGGAVLLGGRSCGDTSEPATGILRMEQRGDGQYEIVEIDLAYHRLGAAVVRVDAAESSFAGQVLVAGGWENAVGGGEIVAKVDRFDPQSDTHSTVFELPTALADAPATALGDGTWLLTGGMVPWGGNPEIHGRYLVLDPVAGEAVDHGAMSTPRYGHRAVSTGEGEVLICGGYRSGEAWDRTTGECELFTDGHGQAVGSMTVDRGNFGLAAFPGGVVAFGGSTQPEGQEPTALDTAEVYDAGEDVWTPVEARMTAARDHVRSLTLDDGRVLVCGGYDTSGVPLSSCEAFDPATLAFVPLPDAVVPGGRADFGLVALDGGLVLLTGGEGEEAEASYLFNP